MEQSRSKWDIGLSQKVSGVVQARLSLYGEGHCSSIAHALRDLRHYITGAAGRREASPAVESALATVLSPTLQEFNPQEHAYDVVAELLDVLGVRAVCV